MTSLLAAIERVSLDTRFHIRIEMGDGKTKPPDEAVKQINTLLKGVKEGMELE